MLPPSPTEGGLCGGLRLTFSGQRDRGMGGGVQAQVLPRTCPCHVTREGDAAAVGACVRDGEDEQRCQPRREGREAGTVRTARRQHWRGRALSQDAGGLPAGVLIQNSKPLFDDCKAHSNIFNLHYSVCVVGILLQLLIVLGAVSTFVCVCVCVCVV